MTKMDTLSLSRFDAELLSHLKNLLFFTPDLKDIRADISVRGRIVHLKGQVKEERERILLRELFSRVKGVHAVWDMLDIGTKRCFSIDLGCAEKKQFCRSIGVDKYLTSQVDLLSDIENGLPFKEMSFDHVFAIHVLEHINNLSLLMNEIHRTLKPDGILHLIVPAAGCVNAIGDPTHVRFFNKKTIEFFCKPYPGLLPFKPLCVSGDSNSLFADLAPVKEKHYSPNENTLSYYFND